MHWINFIFFELSFCSWSLGLDQVIINERQKISDGYKESTEAELSYLTERHGFVDDENLQHSDVYVDIVTQVVSYSNPAEKFLHHFVFNYLNGNNAHDTLITQSHFEDPDKKMRLCPTYLRDPIFTFNQISFLQDPKKHSILYELKFVEFQYFTRRTELVKVVRCPVTVGDFVTRLYFLEVNHRIWNSSLPQRGYFVFINKVVPANRIRSQPLQLLMYVDPDKTIFPEMDTTGPEAELLNALDLVSSRTMKLNLRERRPQRLNWNEEWTARTIMNRMNEMKNFMHYFGEEAEMMLVAKCYGFMDFPPNRARPWRMKKTLLILDSMSEDYLIDREKMDAVKQTEPEKTCKNYISLSDQLTKRQIFPRERPGGARYVSRIVKYTKFDYPDGYKRRELLKCPITYGARRERKYIYLLPIHYKNSAKLPQLFTFFDDSRERDKVNVYLLSQVFWFADNVDYDFIDTNIENVAEASTSTSRPHHSQTTTDLQGPSTTATDLDATSRTTAPVDSDTTSRPTSTVDSDAALLHSDSIVGLGLLGNIEGR